MRIKITKETLENDDKFYSLGLFQKYDTFYSSPVEFEKLEVPKPSPNLAVTVIFELDSLMNEYSRSIYGPLDLLGDVGGLADALTGIGSVVVLVI